MQGFGQGHHQRVIVDPYPLIVNVATVWITEDNGYCSCVWCLGGKV